MALFGYGTDSAISKLNVYMYGWRVGGEVGREVGELMCWGREYGGTLSRKDNLLMKGKLGVSMPRCVC